MRSGLLLRAGLHAQVRQRNLQSRHAEGMQKRKAALRPKRFELRAEVERLGLLIDEAQDRLEDSAKRADALAGRVQDAHDHEHQRSQFRDLREEAIAVEREERARRSRFDAVLREARVRALAERPLYAKNPTLLDVAADDAWAEACFLAIPCGGVAGVLPRSPLRPRAHLARREGPALVLLRAGARRRVHRTAAGPAARGST